MLPSRRLLAFVGLLFYFLIPATIFADVALLPAAPIKPSPITATPITVGVVVPLTGSLSFQGASLRNAMTLAKEDWDKQNLLELITEDDGYIVKNTVTAVNKLRSENKIDFLIVFGANQGGAVVEIAERNALPMVSISVLPSNVKDRKFVTLFMPSCVTLTDLAIREAERRNYKTVAAVASIQDAALLQRDHFAASGKFQIVLSQDFAPTDLDMRAVTSRIQALKPDAVFLSVLPPQGSTFARQLRTSGYKGELFGGLQIGSLSEYKNSDGALTGAWVTAGNDRDMKTYYERYAARFHDKSTAEGPYAYDVIKMLVEALTKGVEPNLYFHTVKDFNGIFGTYGSDGANSFTFEVTVKTFTKEGFVYGDSMR